MNEKHYGDLQGMNKTEMVEKFGAAQVQIWRRSYDVCPQAIAEEDSRHSRHDVHYQGINEEGVTPGTEALIDTTARIIPLWEKEISQKIEKP